MSKTLLSINPATGSTMREFRADTDQQVEEKLRRAVERFREQRRLPFEERARLLNRAADLLESEKARFARIMTEEMGKLLSAAVQEVEKCALGCRFYAANAARFLAEERGEGLPGRSYVRYQPLGPVLAIMPWNFPFWQVFRFAAPALMAGNVALLKHASNVPQCALAIEEIFRRAGAAEGSFQTLLIGGAQASALVADPRIRAVSLTGSLEAGAQVASQTGAHVKKIVLELGGSDPFVVMPSADLERAAATAVQARVINNGQSCIAAKRFILDRRIADEFERRFAERMAALKVGNPMDPATGVGPLATASGLDSLKKQVDASVQLGARVRLGGRPLDCPGFFFAPTILTDIPKNAPAYSEELFGPVAAIFRADGIEEAVQIANDTSFGLGACAWTHEASERDLFLNQVEAGMLFINGMVASHPALPFGGVKQSGFGRELSSFGIREFVNVQTVSIQG